MTGRLRVVRGELWRPRRVYGTPRPAQETTRDECPEECDPTAADGAEKLRVADGWVRFLRRQHIGFQPVHYQDDPDHHITSPHVALVLALSASRQVLVVANHDTWQLRAELERVYRKMGPRPFVSEHNADLRMVLGFGNGHFTAFGGARGWLNNDVGLYQCRECESWYFVDECGGWGCQCNDCDYSGNADLLETFSGRVPRELWERAS